MDARGPVLSIFDILLRYGHSGQSSIWHRRTSPASFPQHQRQYLRIATLRLPFGFLPVLPIRNGYSAQSGIVQFLISFALAAHQTHRARMAANGRNLFGFFPVIYLSICGANKSMFEYRHGYILKISVLEKPKYAKCLLPVCRRSP